MVFNNEMWATVFLIGIGSVHFRCKFEWSSDQVTSGVERGLFLLAILFIIALQYLSRLCYLFLNNIFIGNSFITQWLLVFLLAWSRTGDSSI